MQKFKFPLLLLIAIGIFAELFTHNLQAALWALVALIFADSTFAFEELCQKGLAALKEVNEWLKDMSEKLKEAQGVENPERSDPRSPKA